MSADRSRRGRGRAARHVQDEAGSNLCKSVGNDILDPTLTRPMALHDGVHVAFPSLWTKEQRDEWRRTYVREEWLKARGKENAGD